MAGPDITSLLKDFEFLVKDIIQKFEGKQAARVLSNTVWMTDFIENKAKKQLAVMSRVLSEIEMNSKDTTVQNNAMISKGHVKEMERAFDSILEVYNNEYDFPQVDAAWRTAIPTITEKAKSLRHRIDIITNTSVGKKRIEEEDWYRDL